MFIVLVDVLMKTFFEEACHGCSDFRWRVADHLLKEDFHGEETAEECECAPQPLDTVVGDVSVHDHNGPNAISTHQHRRPPTGRYPAQLEQEDAHIVHKALEDAEYQHSECQPQLVGPDECRRESQRDVQCWCNMRYAWYQRAVVNAHHATKHQLQETELVVFFILVYNKQDIETECESLHQGQRIPVAHCPDSPTNEYERHQVDIVLQKEKSKFLHCLSVVKF